MSWNYRVAKGEDPDGTPWYAIIRVYYNKQGNIEGWTKDPLPLGKTPEELDSDLRMMHDAALYACLKNPEPDQAILVLKDLEKEDSVNSV